MAKKSKFGVTELLKQNKIKRPGRHSKTHKGRKNQNVVKVILDNKVYFIS
jgi:hypothetical protein